MAIRARAEENVARLLREAQSDAGRIRAEADLDGVRRREHAEQVAEQVRQRAEAIRQEADLAAAAEIEAAKARGREMITEAQAVRERVLADLARRRKVGRQQLEQLRAGRDRLLEAYEVVRRSYEQVTAELRNSVPEARVAGEIAAQRVEAEPDEAWLPDALAAAHAALDAGGLPAGDERVEREVAVESDYADVQPAAEPIVEVDRDEVPEATEDEADEGEAETQAESGADEVAARVTAFALGETPTVIVLPSDESGLGGPGSMAHSPVDDLFARIRADRASAVAHAHEVLADATPGGVEVFSEDGDLLVEDEETEPDDFTRRDRALEVPTRQVARQLKRVLADEQNEVLDGLRRGVATASMDALVGTRTAHAERYRVAAAEALWEAALAGAAFVAGEVDPTEMLDREAVLEQALADVETEIVDPLREHVERALAEAGDDASDATDNVRATYREWKTQRFDALADHFAIRAFSLGEFEAAPSDARLCWLVEPGGIPCPDADDNALAGPVPRGEPFPTGHQCPPAHLGCRCLVVVRR